LHIRERRRQLILGDYIVVVGVGIEAAENARLIGLEQAIAVAVILLDDLAGLSARVSRRGAEKTAWAASGSGILAAATPPASAAEAAATLAKASALAIATWLRLLGVAALGGLSLVAAIPAATSATPLGKYGVFRQAANACTLRAGLGDKTRKFQDAPAGQ
jgi:hypothetical protein